MSDPEDIITRDGTFNTEPPDFEAISGNGIRRGNIVIPIVEGATPGDTNITSSSSGFQNNGQPPAGHQQTGLYEAEATGHYDTGESPARLTLSARERRRKTPEEINESKFNSNSSGPTAQKSKTQDILAPHSQADSKKDHTVRSKKLLPGTLIIDQSRKKVVSFNLIPDIASHSSPPRRKQGYVSRNETRLARTLKSYKVWIQKSNKPVATTAQIQLETVTSANSAVHRALKSSNQEEIDSPSPESDEKTNGSDTAEYVAVNNTDDFAKPERTSNTNQAPKTNIISNESGSSQDPVCITANNTDLSSSPSFLATSSGGFEHQNETLDRVLLERNDVIEKKKLYKKRIRQLEEELKGVAIRCQILSVENTEMKNTLNLDKHSSQSTNSRQKLTFENEQLTAKLTEYGKNQPDSKSTKNIEQPKTKNSDLKLHVEGGHGEPTNSLLPIAKDSDIENNNRPPAVNSQSEELEVNNDYLHNQIKALIAQVKSVQYDNAILSTSVEEKSKELSELKAAMQTGASSTDAHLKVMEDKFKMAQEEIEGGRNALEEKQRMLRELEESKRNLQGQLNEKENEVRNLTAGQETKDHLITELSRSLENCRQEKQRLEETTQKCKDAHKEVQVMKSTLDSLKIEAEKSIAENKNLKLEMEIIRRELLTSNDAAKESKNYFTMWESEKDARNKAESKLARSEEEIQKLKARLEDAESMSGEKFSQVKTLQDVKTQEDEAGNKNLIEENMKLRKLLVERNIELTNNKSEKQSIDDRIQLLEQKQHDAELIVQQLSGWAEDVNLVLPAGSLSDSMSTYLLNGSHKKVSPRPVTNSHAQHSIQRTTDQSPFHRIQSEPLCEIRDSHIALVSPQSQKHRQKNNAYNTLTPPPVLNISATLVDINSTNPTSSRSLPSILDTKSLTFNNSHGGYYMLYKEKLKKMKNRKL